MQHVTMDFTFGIKVNGQQTNTVMKEMFGPMFGEEQASKISFYSPRRVGSTMCHLLKSKVEEIHAFGGWAGVHGVKEAHVLKRSMFHRYNGRRA